MFPTGHCIIIGTICAEWCLHTPTKVCIAAGRVTQTRQASPEEADKLCPTMTGSVAGEGGSVGIVKSILLGEETPNANQIFEWGVGHTLTH
jgi:hypothetical protein